MVELLDASLPIPRVLAGQVPRFPRYYQGTATSCRPSRRTSFPSLGDTTGTRTFRSRRRCVRQRRAWGWSPGIPFRVCFRGDDRISQVPGEPPCAHALLFDHGGTLGPSLFFGLRVLPYTVRTASASAIEFSGLYHTACALPVYALQRRSPLRHTRLGSGGWPALPDRIDYLLGSITRFQLLVSCFLLVQACLAHSDPLALRRPRSTTSSSC